jgi:Metallo-beta-lactamase superfamily
VPRPWPVSSAGSSLDLRPPDPEELEVSLFGPGYGESLVLHLGGGRWMIVDSCIDPTSGRAAALDYLDALRIDCATDVAIVLATHWHDDHVRGIAAVVEACEGARFLCSTAVRGSEFLTLTQSTVLGADRTTSGIREFASVLEIVRSRRAAGRHDAGPDLVLANKVIDESPFCEVRALSPSSASLERAMAAIAAMLPEPLRPHLRVAAPSSNEGSIALWVRGSCGQALLAADIERQATDDRGWGAILALRPAASSGPAGLVKVPHHGSESGHDQRMWDDLLQPQPAAILTPWSRGARSLPTEEDRRRLVRLAPDAILVGQSAGKPARYDRAVERTLKEVTQTRRRAIGRTGHARARCGPADSGAWRVQLINHAHRLSAAA